MCISYINSGPMIGNAFEINRRIVSVMRLLGIGINGLNLFCGLMDLVSTFYRQTFMGCFENLWTAAESVYKFSVRRAVQEEKELTLENENSNINLTVSGDGTWKKRGHTSHFGVTTLAGKYSKKIIDTSVKSTLCQSCEFWEKKKDTDPEDYDEWLSQHDDCDANHIGSASKMEVDSVKEMFSRSMENCEVKYTRYIGDGDSATYKGLLDLNPYDVPVEKIECKGNNTQNNNESYNGLLWYFAPKHLHSNFKTVELSNFLSVMIFNDGFSSVLKMFIVMGIIIGPAARDYAAARDDTRLRVAHHRHRASSKEGRIARRRSLSAQQILFEEEEGPLYGPGIAD